MYRFLLLYLISAVGTNLFGQTKPNFFPEEVESQVVGIRCFCEPGIKNKSRSKGLELRYLLRGNGNFTSDEVQFSRPYTSFERFEQFGIRLRVPIINRVDLKLLLGYKHESEVYNLDQIGPDFTESFEGINGKKLKSNAFNLLLVKSLNEVNYLAFRGSFAMNGDYKGWLEFDHRYTIYKGAIILGVKKSEDFEWGPGIAFSSSFRQNSLLPFLLFNKNFNDRWGVESIFPAFVNFRYNLNQNTILLFGGEYSSQSYRTTFSTSNAEQFDYSINHSEMIASIQLEKKLASWVWTNLKVGYQENFSTDFGSKTDVTPPFKAEPSNFFIFQVGLFLSPPD